MAMTITEKILAKAAGKKNVEPGVNVWLDVDVLMTHDVCGPPTIDIWKREFGGQAKIWDKDKLVIFPDHYIFTKNPQANRNVEILREFANEFGIQNYYDVGTDRYKGVCHIALAEEGMTYQVLSCSVLTLTLALPAPSECFLPVLEIPMRLLSLEPEKFGKKFPSL